MNLPGGTVKFNLADHDWQISDEEYIEIGKTTEKLVRQILCRGDAASAPGSDEGAGVEEVIEPVGVGPIIIPAGEEAPWLVKARECEGMHEDTDREALMAFMDGYDPAEAWCAAYLNSCLEKCGIKGTGSPSSLSFQNWGVECDLQDNAIVVFVNARRTGGHVGILCRNKIKIFGGNQGDSAKESNAAWYFENMEHVATRIPEGYELALAA